MIETKKTGIVFCYPSKNRKRDPVNALFFLLTTTFVFMFTTPSVFDGAIVSVYIGSGKSSTKLDTLETI